MNTKITFVELVDLMAEATSTSKRVCELFLMDLFATVSQALIDGESVKIKGIGTFKIIQVKPRKSVNVKTGEAMQVAGYNKVTFTPDKSMAEALNQPFAQFESVVLDDKVTDEQLAEIDKSHPSTITSPRQDQVDSEADIIAPTPEDTPQQMVEELFIGEMGMSAAPLPFDLPEMQDAAPAPGLDELIEKMSGGEKASKHREPEPVEEKPAQKKPTPKPETKKPVEKQSGKAKQEEKEKVQSATSKPMPERKPMLVGIPIDGPSQPKPEPEKPEEVDSNRRFYRPELRNTYTPTPEQIEEASRKPDRRWLWALLGVLGAALLFWLIARGCSDSNAEQQEQVVVAADTLTEADTVSQEVAPAETKSKPEPKPEVKPEPEAKPEAKPEPKPEAKPATAATPNSKEVTDVVTSQVVLTTLAEKYYGSQWFWVYIYEENLNRGIIDDPNNIKPGTRVVIPPAEKYGINAKDKESLKKARYKSWEYFKDN